MRVGLMKSKTQIYLLILGLVLTLIGMAVMRSCRDAPGTDAARAMDASQKLESLEKAAPQSPEMRRFLEQEKAQQEANQEATGDSPR